MGARFLMLASKEALIRRIPLAITLIKPTNPYRPPRLQYVWRPIGLLFLQLCHVSFSRWTHDPGPFQSRAKDRR